MKITLLAALCAATSVVSTAVQADVRFNGFASVYAGITLDDDEFLYGYDDEVSFKPETLFGLQATADLMDGLTATVQILGRGAEDFDAEIEWAYLTYTVNDNIDISAGRLRLPLFKYSEYLDVGFAHPWARTPRDVYGVNFNTMEGIRGNYMNSMGMWDIEVQVIYGSLEDDLQFGLDPTIVPTTMDSLMGISVNLTRDWFSFRAGYTTADLTLKTSIDALEPFFDAFNPELFDELQLKDDHGYFGNIGIFIDYEDWLFNAERVNYNTQNAFGVKTEAFYAMAGKRFGDFVLTYTYSEREETNEFGVADQIPAIIPNPNPATVPICGATGAEFIRNCVIQAGSENSTHNVALRWNFHPSASFT